MSVLVPFIFGGGGGLTDGGAGRDADICEGLVLFDCEFDRCKPPGGFEGNGGDVLFAFETLIIGTEGAGPLLETAGGDTSDGKAVILFCLDLVTLMVLNLFRPTELAGDDDDVLLLLTPLPPPPKRDPS